MSAGTVIETDVASRLDRLPWTRWHWLIVSGLGVTWVLDGLEVTLVGALGGVLKSPSGLGLNDFLLDLSASFYLAGNVAGAIIFGFLTDRLGRKRLFFITLSLYLTASALSGLAWNPWIYFLFRFLTGAGIGGEYSARLRERGSRLNLQQFLHCGQFPSKDGIRVGCLSHNQKVIAAETL
jgi:MFS family permease